MNAFPPWRRPRSHGAHGSGSTAGMVAADAIAIWIGATLGTRLPDRAMKLFSGGAFVVFGALLIAEGLGMI